MNKSYLELRKTCKLVDYAHKLAAGGELYVETYTDGIHQYQALFTLNSASQFPVTITTIKQDDFCKNPS